MREIFKKFLECQGIIHKVCMEIWNYIFDNYADHLEFGKDSRFYNWDINVEALNFEYFDFTDNYDFTLESIEDIPLEVICNDTWKEYIDEHINEIIQ